MKAVILAGGKGTRLRPLTYTRAKPMVPFLNKPVMEHIINKLSKEGFDDIVITTNYKAAEIDGYFGDGSDWGVKIRTVEEKEPLGTAGSVKNAIDHLDNTFAVIQGDSVTDIDVSRVVETHRKNEGKATLCLMRVDEVSHYGIAEMEGAEIVRFKEKPKKEETFSNLANSGIYILEPEILDMIPLEFYDFSKNLFPRMLKEGKKICGHTTTDYWMDIGKPEAYLAATMHYLNGQNMFGENCQIDPGAEIEESVLGNGCKIGAGAELEGSAIFDNVELGQGAEIEDSIIGSNCRIGAGAEVEDSVIGDNVVVGEGARIEEGSRIGPDVEVKAGEKISGTIVPDKYKD
jgi:mannose-1-phosphate guanylyltransferase